MKQGKPVPDSVMYAAIADFAAGESTLRAACDARGFHYNTLHRRVASNPTLLRTLLAARASRRDRRVANQVHGTRQNYMNNRCRCAECREANTAFKRAADADRAARGVPEHVPHGRASTYLNWLCRCQPCTKAHTAYCAPYVAAYNARQRAKRGAA